MGIRTAYFLLHLTNNLPVAAHPHLLITLLEITATVTPVIALLIMRMRATETIVMAITTMEVSVADHRIRHRTPITGPCSTATNRRRHLPPMATTQSTTIQTVTIMDPYSSIATNLELKLPGGDEGICPEIPQIC